MKPITSYLFPGGVSGRAHLLFSLYFLCSFIVVQAQPGKVIIDAGSSPGYVLFAPESSTSTYLINKNDKQHDSVFHKWTSANQPGMAVHLLRNGDLLRAENIRNPNPDSNCNYPGGLIAVYHWDGTLKWSHTINSERYQQTHDAYPMPNGNVLVDVWEKITNKEAYLFGRDTLLDAAGYFWSGMLMELQQIPKTKKAKVVWKWRFIDHVTADTATLIKHPELLNINFLGTPMAASNIDWTHMNAVVYDSALDQILISSRNLNEIYVIEHLTSTDAASHHKGGKYGKGGDFIYRWGNPQAYHAHGPQQLFGQHSPYWLPGSNKNACQIMINNDGYQRPGGDTTTVNIIKPPFKDGKYEHSSGKAFGPSAPHWTYTAPWNLRNTFQGSAQRLPDGNTIICAAVPPGMNQQATFYEIDKAQPHNIVWEYQLLGFEGGAFRCHQYTNSYVEDIIKRQSKRD